MIPTAHLRFCSERGHLLDLLTTAANDYAKLANELAGEMSTMSPTVYRQRRSDVEHARMDAQQAREALLAHQKEHGC